MKYLYHWTHKANLASISERGLLPEMSETAQPEVWMGCEGRIAWGLSHIATRHAWNPDDMVLIRVKADKLSLIRTAYPGVFKCKDVIPPSKLRGVKMSLLEPFTPVCKRRQRERS